MSILIFQLVREVCCGMSVRNTFLKQQTDRYNTLTNDDRLFVAGVCCGISLETLNTFLKQQTVN